MTLRRQPSQGTMPGYPASRIPMRPRPRPLLFLLQSAVVGLAGAFVVLYLAPGWAERLRNGPAAESNGSVFSYADAVRRASPSVVSIYADREVTVPMTVMVPDATTQRFSGITDVPTRRRLRALGSGVIVSEDGFMLTNHHVVLGAEQIEVVLWDGRVTRAQVVGSDPETDLAVLKMEGSGLPALKLDPEVASSVGDVVLAIGNPFGLSQTVTQGIVSGLGRSTGKHAFAEDFIQTDAAINNGNSGGALVNARGELIGINTLVLSRRSDERSVLSGAEGIGFAIPMRIAAQIFREIRENGVVTRGWIGAEYDDAPVLPGSLAPGSARGVALRGIYRGGPAYAAGLRAGDVLLEFDREPIADQASLRTKEAALAPGSKINIAGLRAGVPFQGELELIQRPSSQ